ncbi:MAG: hypothetical protein A3A27_00415 [Candidatus Wildermuthbacteria bacterium RIFCSPLOWO2_01_FULL_47_18]|uniref:LTD domain-containing protein n=1 Tax=Candidatus Wildermuthbacteria bacterium RIFCSPLOWO2_01_FULL_47_18 TaxID=1802460 RepID=A0A1G2RK52_9BACT|nr:MAG: hypothetical protein A3A27_00415 [Candidatus Wildermuthbacteria bacterium RIFCSPLOWO2_01_FULL_47_18]
MIFFIPFIVIVGVLLLSFAGSALQDIGLDFSFPDFSGYFTPQLKSGGEKTPSATVQQKSQSSQQTKLSPRPPPPTPQAQQPPTTQNSPWFEKIVISSFERFAVTPNFMLVLRPNFSEDTPVSITGWRIKSKITGEATLAKGIEKYHPVFATEALDNIMVKRSDTVYVSGGESPIGRGIHFRPNACFGYLKQYYPSLPGSYSCSGDRPTLEEVSNLAPGCQEFILNKINYSYCQVPDMGAVATNQECVAYIQNTSTGFNYQGCYAQYSKDSNFLANEWRIYLDTSLGHPLHDTITLYDQNGLVVDTYIY